MPALQEIRALFCQEFLNLPDRFKALESPPHYPVAVSPSLEELTAQVQEEILTE